MTAVVPDPANPQVGDVFEYRIPVKVIRVYHDGGAVLDGLRMRILEPSERVERLHAVRGSDWQTRSESAEAERDALAERVAALEADKRMLDFLDGDVPGRFRGPVAAAMGAAK